MFMSSFLFLFLYKEWSVILECVQTISLITLFRPCSNITTNNLFIHIYIMITNVNKYFRIVVQDVPAQPRERHQSREAETAADTHDVHERPAEGAGEGLLGDSLPGYLHERGNSHENWSHWGPGTGGIQTDTHTYTALILGFSLLLVLMIIQRKRANWVYNTNVFYNGFYVKQMYMYVFFKI